MVKKLSVLLLLAGLLLPFHAGFAQEDDQTPRLNFDDPVSGEITNVNYDQEYIFEGTAGDVVVITLTRSEMADFDPKLYLTTLENEIIAENDDFFDLNSRIVVRLPSTQTYQVVATRLGERAGTGQGAYTLLMEKAQVFTSGTVVEGTVSAYAPSPGHIFVPEAAGIYTITYKRVRGDYFPALTIHQIFSDINYTEQVGYLAASTLHGGSITIEVELDAIYVLGFESGYYSGEGELAVYTITVEQLEVEGE